MFHWLKKVKRWTNLHVPNSTVWHTRNPRTQCKDWPAKGPAPTSTGLQLPFPFLDTRDLDSAGLKPLLAHKTSGWRSRLHQGTDVVVNSGMVPSLSGSRSEQRTTALNLSRLHKHVHGRCKKGQRDCAASDGAAFTLKLEKAKMRICISCGTGSACLASTRKRCLDYVTFP